MTWLTGWNYRKPIVISNSGSSLSNYQVLVTINASSLVSAGKMLSNGDDIRFTDSGGSSLIYYWIESGTISSTTNIWVNVPSIAASPTTTTIYMYYGNSSATAASDGVNTFIQFTDFSSSTGWSLGSGWAISSGIMNFTGGSTTALYSTTTVTQSQYIVGARVKGTVSNFRIFMGAESNSPFTGNSETGSTLYSYGGYANKLMRYNNGSPYLSGAVSFTVANGTWNILEIVIDETGNNYISRAYTDDRVSSPAITSNSAKGSGTGNTVGILGVAGEYISVDWLYVKKYVSSEPTAGTPGTEESLSCGPPSCNLIILSGVYEMLINTPPGHLELDKLSDYVDIVLLDCTIL